MQIKTTIRYHYLLWEWPKEKKKKNLTVPSADEDVKPQDLSDIATGNVKRHSNFGKQFGSFS